MWSVAITETRNGPSHLVGSVLALDLAMAPLALRRISTDRVPEAPMLNLVQRDSFAATRRRHESARAHRRGSRRDRCLHRARAARVLDGLDPGAKPSTHRDASSAWTAGGRARSAGRSRHEPAARRRCSTMTELLVLGGGLACGVQLVGHVRRCGRAGCLCTRAGAARPGGGRGGGCRRSGCRRSLVSDLPLRVAVVLHNLHLPGVLARPVLAAAMQDFVDSVNPTDGNDWLTLARAAQAIDRRTVRRLRRGGDGRWSVVPDAPDKAGT